MKVALLNNCHFTCSLAAAAILFARHTSSGWQCRGDFFIQAGIFDAWQNKAISFCNLKITSECVYNVSKEEWL